jgi:hypothetical protein
MHALIYTVIQYLWIDLWLGPVFHLRLIMHYCDICGCLLVCIQSSCICRIYRLNVNKMASYVFVAIRVHVWPICNGTVYNETVNKSEHVNIFNGFDMDLDEAIRKCLDNLWFFLYIFILIKNWNKGTINEILPKYNQRKTNSNNSD